MRKSEPDQGDRRNLNLYLLIRREVSLNRGCAQPFSTSGPERGGACRDPKAGVSAICALATGHDATDLSTREKASSGMPCWAKPCSNTLFWDKASPKVKQSNLGKKDARTPQAVPMLKVVAGRNGGTILQASDSRGYAQFLAMVERLTGSPCHAASSLFLFEAFWRVAFGRCPPGPEMRHGIRRADQFAGQRQARLQ